ncbi:MAG: SDR family NAD(P)-dependent oxidoreductase [Mesorhizobium sp.]|nr:SDR family NAD(P)-dependent oxidoreductase [Mesorhizobium sp.]RWA75880.1 MAG: SDR family NAD(P)-dependent oxidoreductase [Mesorhizobium sp.]TIS78474.1 MAG: SDR family NAD(P)-dependent oxidoreductase [Mesorhizobium sp.]TIV73180.1 MAG: SDR family NAD(P)-dependent oxidoreductase [Mesorhizobium sp.]
MSDHSRRVLVTAGSNGLGLAIAKRLAKDRAEIVICARNQSTLDKAVAELRNIEKCGGAHGIVADLARRSDVDMLFGRTLELLGHIDLLVVNSGHMPYGNIEYVSDEDWDHSYETLLMSAVRLSRAAAGVMKASGHGGDILYVSSAGVHEATGHLLLSNVMRAAIAVLAKHLADTLTGSGIRVNVVAPGYLDTGRVHNRIEALWSTKALIEMPPLNASPMPIPWGGLELPMNSRSWLHSSLATEQGISMVPQL